MFFLLTPAALSLMREGRFCLVTGDGGDTSDQMSWLTGRLGGRNYFFQFKCEDLLLAITIVNVTLSSALESTLT
jgi:hypothetical protein